jgi:hypothetical protein
MTQSGIVVGIESTQMLNIKSAFKLSALVSAQINEKQEKASKYKVCRAPPKMLSYIPGLGTIFLNPSYSI